MQHTTEELNLVAGQIADDRTVDLDDWAAIVLKLCVMGHRPSEYGNELPVIFHLASAIREYNRLAA